MLQIKVLVCGLRSDPLYYRGEAKRNVYELCCSLFYCKLHAAAAGSVIELGKSNFSYCIIHRRIESDRERKINLSDSEHESVRHGICLIKKKCISSAVTHEKLCKGPTHAFQPVFTIFLNLTFSNTHGT